MANSTADCALLLEVLAGYDDGLDPMQSAALVPKPYTSALARGISGLRFGIVREGFGTAGSEADGEEMVRAAALRLREATVRSSQVPPRVGRFMLVGPGVSQESTSETHSGKTIRSNPGGPPRQWRSS
jgi:Asp-tRNA(Asn)/Glu-tRNA(Gln) amidotransferase A subunit family amidase